MSSIKTNLRSTWRYINPQTTAISSKSWLFSWWNQANFASVNYKLHNPHWKYSAHTSGYHPKQICLLITNFEEILRDDDSCLIWSCCSWRFRAVGRSENPGVPVLFGGNNLLLLAEIGLIGLPKSGGAMAPPAPPGTTGLILFCCCQRDPCEFPPQDISWW